MSDLKTNDEGAPDRIYLQLHGNEPPPYDEQIDATSGDVSWCWHQIFEHDIEYVREDIANDMYEALEATMELLHRGEISPGMVKETVMAALAKAKGESGGAI